MSAGRGIRNRKYLLIVLLIILAFNYVDRVALGLVLQEIKTAFSLSDTDLGILSGIAFAAFYAVMGIPIALWADRGNRVRIISLTSGLWGIAVALSGISRSFLQLMIVRTCVAVGEAGCVPPANSLIPEYFERHERARAMAIYMQGAPISLVVGYFAAGWLNQFYGWRRMFEIIGVPGALLALLAWRTLKEPRLERATYDIGEIAVGKRQPVTQQLTEIGWALRTSGAFRNLILGFSIVAFFSYGVSQWLPTFYVRSYGVSTGELGMWLATALGISGMGGTWLGGTWASRYAARNEKLQLRIVAFAYGFYGIIFAGAFLVSSFYCSLLLVSLANFGGYTSVAPLFATIQTLVPSRMRAMAVAVVYLFANLVGMGLGPLTAGALSDGMRVHFGAESLRYALMFLSPGWLWGGYHLWRASRTIMSEMQNDLLSTSESQVGAV